MSQGPIPPSILFSYADRFVLIGTLEEFMKIIFAMDNVYLKHTSDERAKESKRAKQTAKR